MLPIQYSKLGYHRASKTPFFVNVGPPLTKLSGSAYADDSHAILNLIMFLKKAATCENVVF